MTQFIQYTQLQRKSQRINISNPRLINLKVRQVILAQRLRLKGQLIPQVRKPVQLLAAIALLLLDHATLGGSDVLVGDNGEGEVGEWYAYDPAAQADPNAKAQSIRVIQIRINFSRT